MTESRHVYKWVTDASNGDINLTPIHVTSRSGVCLRKIDIWDFGFESRPERIEVLGDYSG